MKTELSEVDLNKVEKGEIKRRKLKSVPSTVPCIVF